MGWAGGEFFLDAVAGGLLPEVDFLVEFEGNNHGKGGGKDVLKNILSIERAASTQRCKISEEKKNLICF